MDSRFKLAGRSTLADPQRPRSRNTSTTSIKISNPSNSRVPPRPQYPYSPDPYNSTFKSSATRSIYSYSKPTEYSSPVKVDYVRQSREIPKTTEITAVPRQDSMGLVGLRNLGNTCYMNSILQCLVHTPCLNEAFMSRDFPDEINRSSKLRGELAIKFKELIKEFKELPRNSSVSPYNIKSLIGRISSQFLGYSQQDAAELLRAMLEGLHLDLNRVRTKPSYRQMTGSLKEGLEEVARTWWEYSLSRDNSIITDTFQGQLLSMITCKACNHKSISCDSFLDLTLPIPQYSKVSLLDCFKSFVKEGNLPSYKCENCKKPDNCKQEVTLYRFPKVLVLQLKRFTVNGFRREKLSNEINLPEVLRLEEFAPHSTSSNVSKARYRLYGVSNHMGGLSFGHYVADCVDQGSWYCFDDSRVSPTETPTRSSSAYVLFYYRID